MSLLDCARTDCFSPLQIVKLCKERELTPAIVFSFSRRECEKYGRAVAKLDFTTPEDKEAIGHIFTSAMDVLSEADRQLTPVRGCCVYGMHAGAGADAMRAVPRRLRRSCRCFCAASACITAACCPS